MTTPNDDLSEDERVLEKMTAEPWHLSTNGSIVQTAHITRDVWQIPHCEEDMPGIVHLRNRAPAWLKELRELRAMCNVVRRLMTKPKISDDHVRAIIAGDMKTAAAEAHEEFADFAAAWDELERMVANQADAALAARGKE
jgi:hypothetical protein